MSVKPQTEQDVLTKLGRQELFTNYRKIQANYSETLDEHSINLSNIDSKNPAGFFRNEHTLNTINIASTKADSRKVIHERREEDDQTPKPKKKAKKDARRKLISYYRVLKAYSKPPEEESAGSKTTITLDHEKSHRDKSLKEKSARPPRNLPAISKNQKNEGSSSTILIQAKHSTSLTPNNNKTRKLANENDEYARNHDSDTTDQYLKPKNKITSNGKYQSPNRILESARKMVKDQNELENMHLNKKPIKQNQKLFPISHSKKPTPSSDELQLIVKDSSFSKMEASEISTNYIRQDRPAKLQKIELDASTSQVISGQESPENVRIIRPRRPEESGNTRVGYIRKLPINHQSIDSFDADVSHLNLSKSIHSRALSGMPRKSINQTPSYMDYKGLRKSTSLDKELLNPGERTKRLQEYLKEQGKMRQQTLDYQRKLERNQLKEKEELMNERYERLMKDLKIQEKIVEVKGEIKRAIRLPKVKNAKVKFESSDS